MAPNKKIILKGFSVKHKPDFPLFFPRHRFRSVNFSCALTFKNWSLELFKSFSAITIVCTAVSVAALHLIEAVGERQPYLAGSPL